MNREIKFRAWDKKYNVMLCEGFSIIGEVTLFGGVEITLSEQSKIHNDQTPGLIRLNDVIVMQFTGLQEMNGVDIYEGDLVKVKNSVHLVVWKYGGFVLEYKLRKGEEITVKHFPMPKHLSKKYLKVGNIYENPELF